MAGDWIPIETETPRKLEVLRIARITGLPRHHVLGILVEFWCWASAQTVDGCVDADVGALAPLFETEPEFWEALIEVGWLTKSTEHGGVLCIPNAEHWLTKSAKSRLAKNRRQSRHRQASTSAPPKRHARATQSASKASTTEQNRTEDKKEKSTSLSLAQKIYEAYPRHVGKAKALTAIDKAIEGIAERGAGMMKKDAVAWLLERVQKFAESPAGKRGTFTPHPTTWMNGGRYDDDDAEWQRTDDKSAGPAGVAAPAGKYDAI